MSKAQKTSPRTGRPSKYKPEMIEQAQKLCALGATDKDVADFFGVTDRTLYRWQLEYPEFCKALKLGKEAPDDRVERSLFHRATGYTHKAVKIFADPKTGAQHIVEYDEHYPPDTTAMIFWLKNRRPDLWRDRVEHTGKNGGPIETSDMTETEIARRIAFTLQQGLKIQDKTH